MKTKALLIFVFFVSFRFSAVSQNVGISASGTVPNNSAMLDVVSDSRGMLIPRMTTAQRGTIPLPLAIGLEIFNTDCNNFNYWNGSCWVTTSKNLPAPRNLTGNTDMCAATVQAYSITAVPGATYYNWTVPAGATFTGQGTLSISVTFGNFSGQVCVTANNDCETSSATCTDVSISPIPNTPGNITGPISLPPGENPVQYFIASVEGASVYNWTVPPGANITSGGGTTTITVEYYCTATSGSVTVTAQSSCGTSAASSLAVTVTPFIAVNAGVDKFAGVTIGGTATGGEGTYTYSWTPANNLSSYTVAAPTALCTGTTTTYTETVTDANGCTVNDAVVVTRNLAVNAGADLSMPTGCSKVIGPATGSGGAGSYTYLWSPSTGLDNAAIANPTSTVGSTTTYTVTVTDANGCTATDAMTLTVGGGTPVPPFNYTGGLQTWTVPGGVTCIFIDAYGAQGSAGGCAGGLGGRSQGNLAVTPGATINVYVGGQAGFNGGGSGGCTCGCGGNGGGASDVRVGGVALSNRVIVAGAGGGGGRNGGWSCGAGGVGGGTTGGAGGTSNGGGGPAGQGGTQSAGGAAGIGCGGCIGVVGSLGVGGNGSACGTWCSGGAGGGGGGYYGGGGGGICGSGEGGGGGSSYTGGVTGGSTTAGVRSGNGQITITY